MHHFKGGLQISDNNAVVSNVVKCDVSKSQVMFSCAVVFFCFVYDKYDVRNHSHFEEFHFHRVKEVRIADFLKSP